MNKGWLIFLLPLLIVGFFAGYFWAHGASVPKQYHYLTITERAYYDSFFAGETNCKNNYTESIGGLIVNHHLLAGKFIASALCQVATDQKITVVLLSPNHFSNGRGHIIVSTYNWQTPYGALEANSRIINSMVKDKVASNEEDPFAFEHGIYNVIPFIKKTMPNIQIIPLIIKESATQEEKQNLEQFINNKLPGQTLIISSLDFSHYLTSDEADKADEKSLSVIERLDFKQLEELNPKGAPDNVDSKATLDIFLNLMKEKSLVFKLLAHSNSAKLIGDLSLKEVTSYIAGLFMLK